MSDVVLVSRCLAGDPAATRELVERFQQDVYGLCLRFLAHQQDAEDVAQEVFLRVFRSLNRWDPTRPLRPWVMAITLNRCRTWAGRRGKGPELADYLHELADHRPEDDSLELAGAIRVAVDGLREDYRTVFVLYHERGHSYEEISEAVGRPVGTIKTWLHRARLEVLDCLRSQGLVDESPDSVKPPVFDRVQPR